MGVSLLPLVLKILLGVVFGVLLLLTVMRNIA